jgi:predicted phosphodiesterase
MKILPVSDLHLEWHADQGQSFLASLDPTGVDVLVIAGDLAHTESLKSVLEGLAQRFKHVVYVAGNHCYYGFNPEQAKGHFNRAKAPNLHWLNQSTVTIEGVRFVGTTLWFPRPPRKVLVENYPDFWYIKGFRPWVFDEHQAALHFLKSELRPKDVLVTHFFPLRESIAFGSDLNCFFWSGKEADRIVRERRPRLLIHGHTHFSFRYWVGPTEVICNPLGYPTEPNRKFDERLIVEV